MTSFYQIKNIEDKWYDDFYKIYSMSFPIYEQRDREQQIKAFNNEHYKLLCLIKDDLLLSFISCWDFDQYVYIEHLAVDKGYRGQNVGATTLSSFIDLVGKTIILEIDPIIDEISSKRLKFYQKIGFNKNEYKHTHPSYNKKYKPHELLILNTGETLLSENLYDTFNTDLCNIVMSDK